MIEKVTLKDTFAGLTKATDVDSIIARDKNGNPVYISKADLAAVAAELMPVATAAAKGLMSADDKKYAPQYINIGKGSARKLFDFTASYQQYVLALFVIVGLKPAHLILYGRSEATISDIRLYFDKIRVESSSLKFYRKNDSIYISNESLSDPCKGTALSVFPIGNEAVTIDETFTEIPIE